MIKNVIFDIGNVLAKFRWQKLFKELGFEGEVFDHVADATVRGPWWPEYDRSRMSDEEIWQRCCALAPEYSAQIMAVFENVENICEEYDYARSWIYSLKAAGYRIYLLSNYGRTSFEKARQKFSFMDLADGQVISYEVEEIKPDRAIFEALEKKYGILPEESVFLDDTMKNVKAAKSYGYHAIFFENQALAAKKLEGMGVFALPVSEDDDRKFMKEALKQAKKAAALGEVPIGCVIVKDGDIIARGYNQRNKKHSTLGHGEISAIGKASKALIDWRLTDCTLYVTLEPCSMCAGAMIQARLGRAVIGAMNPKAGCAGSVMNMLQMDGFNHKVHVTRGILKEQCSDLLTGFFTSLREGRQAGQGQRSGGDPHKTGRPVR